ncbi:MAG TPA: hypothetical protein VN922_06580, partial [Bacteroidia bacterium]|nr:hypothetical protein [Bacteroidia bacterium]
YTCVIQSDDSDKNVSNYYIRKNHADTSFNWTDNFGCFITHPSNYVRFIRFMEKQHTPYFAYGCTAQFDPIVLHIITGYYPYLVRKWDFAGASFFLLTNIKTADRPALYSFESLNNFEGPKEYWAKTDTNQLCDTLYYSATHSCKMDWYHEWAPDFSCKLNNVSWNKNDVIEVSLEVYPLDTLTDVKIVSVLESEGKTIEWRATPVNSFIADTIRRKWVKVYHTMKLQDMDINYPNMQLKVYMWNRGKKKFYMDDFSVKVVKGNPVIYGLFEKI